MTSLRWDPQLQNHPKNPFSSVYYMLAYHQERLLAAAEDFGWDTAKDTLNGSTGLAYLTNVLDSHVSSTATADTWSKERSFKLRVFLSQDGQLTVSSNEVPKVQMEHLMPTTLPVCMPDVSKVPVTWCLYVSPIQSIPSLHTRHKTTHRSTYDEVRACIPHEHASVGPGTIAEILVVNDKDEIMEGSITTPYFLRHGQWVTPPVNAGGNVGTTRRWALEKGLCVERILTRYEVLIGEAVWLSNGARGWGVGIVTNMPT